MDETTAQIMTRLIELVTVMSEKIDRMDDVLSRYEPMLEEAGRRLARPPKLFGGIR